MFERITPNAATSYEQNLVEYVGFVFLQDGNLTVSASPGVTVSRLGVGLYTVACNDYLPIYSQINNHPYTVGGSPAQTMGAIAAGFASTAMMSVTAIQTTTPPFTGSVNAFCSVPQIVSLGSIAWNIGVVLNGTLADAGFTFKILVTGQMDQFVNGIGA